MRLENRKGVGSIVIGSINGSGTSAIQFPSSQQNPKAVDSQSRAEGKQEELTTVTTHCSKHHKHTAACPHTTFTRPADENSPVGRYVDTFA